MAKVLFITKELKMEPLGIMYLSAALKAAGHQVELARCDVGPSPKFMIGSFRPDWVCYSVCSGLEDFYFNLDRELWGQVPPEFTPVYGGPAVTFNHEKYRSRSAIRGEGENSLVRLISDYTVIPPELVDVNAMYWPDRELVYRFEDLHDNPIKNVVSRRGCKYACSYCFNRNWNKMFEDQLPKGVIRYRYPEDVVMECRRIAIKWPVKMFNFVDDNFLSSTEWLKKFSRCYRDTVGIPFFCSARPEDVNMLTASLLKQAGCAIMNMAIESANAENRRRVLTRVCTNDAVTAAVNTLRLYGIRTRLQNIIGLPVDDPLADALETLDFNIKARPTSSWCAILQAYQGTRIYEIAQERGVAPEDGAVDSGFFGTSTLKIRDRRKIERLHKIWHVVVRFPWLRSLVGLVIRLPLPFSVFRWFFRRTKRWLARKELWQVFRKE